MLEKTYEDDDEKREKCVREHARERAREPLREREIVCVSEHKIEREREREREIERERENTHTHKSTNVKNNM